MSAVPGMNTAIAEHTDVLKGLDWQLPCEVDDCQRIAEGIACLICPRCGETVRRAAVLCRTDYNKTLARIAWFRARGGRTYCTLCRTTITSDMFTWGPL